MLTEGCLTNASHDSQSHLCKVGAYMKHHAGAHSVHRRGVHVPPRGRLYCTRVRATCVPMWCGLSERGPWRFPRPGLPASPSTPCPRHRCTHVETKRQLSPTVPARCEIGTLSARSKMIRPRRARPAGMVVERCQAVSVARSSGVRWIASAVLRPRGITMSRWVASATSSQRCRDTQPRAALTGVPCRECLSPAAHRTPQPGRGVSSRSPKATCP